MYRKASELERYKVRTRDGDELGKVKDLYFDDESWTLRYFVVDTGGWLPGRKLLISPEAAERLDWPVRELPVNLSREQMEKAPGIDEDKPVSRQEEERYRAYYTWPPYWGGAISAPSIAVAYPPALSPEGQPGMTQQEQELAARRDEEYDSHLRSMDEVKGYDVEAEDGEIGRVEDFLIDDETWQVRYLLVDTRKWLPGKDVLLPAGAVRGVRWATGKIAVTMPKDAVQSAPEFDASAPLGRDDEAALYAHYGLRPYWEAA